MVREADRQIVIDVMRYFLRNPQAADTLEGIARWRLLEERISESVSETRAAIFWLVENGFLTRVSSAAAEPLFQLNAAARSRALELVNSVSSASTERSGE